VHDLGYLDEVTNRALKQVAVFFAECNFKELRQSEFPVGDFIAAWQGNIMCNGVDVSIIVALTEGFPDELPKIFLTKDFEYLPIPHVDNRLFVCTYVSESTDFFSENVDGVIRDSIEKAREIISDGIHRVNQSDYEAEFLAYWELDCKSLYSILEPVDRIRKVKMAIVHLAKHNIAYLVADDENAIRGFAANVNPDFSIQKFDSALYLPLPHPFPPPFPETCKEMFSVLDSYDKKYSNAVVDFLNNNDYQGTVVFSTIINDNYALAGWRHQAMNRKEVLRGFRPGKVDPRVLKNLITNQSIERLQVERLDLDRVQGRVGNSNSALHGKTICIIGCGSIGSWIAFNLVQAGIDRLMLIDKDSLHATNIGRHLCGVTEIKKSKVEAVSERIRQHLPYVRIQCIEQTFYKAFTENQEAIQNCDLIISATANPALERRLNKMQLNASAFPPVLYSWIEPYGIASHAVLVSTTETSCFECCLDPKDLSFKFQVLRCERGAFTRQEAGCQSSFTPYSGLDANQAASIATRLALKSLSGDITNNIRYVFFGDLQKAREMELDISEEYTDASDFTMKASIIQKAPDCKVCSDINNHD